MNVWHYTTGQRLADIIISQEIRPATAFVDANEKPVVWFSTSPDWEEVANKMLQEADGSIQKLSKQETARLASPPARICIKPSVAPYIWEDYVKLSGIRKDIVKSLIEVAEEVGSDVRKWRVSFSPVSISEWIDIEIWNDEAKKWQSSIKSSPPIGRLW